MVSEFGGMKKKKIYNDENQNFLISHGLKKYLTQIIFLKISLQ